MASQSQIMLSVGRDALQQGRLQDAENALRSVLADEPDNGEAIHFLGLACLRQGRVEDALNLLREAADVMPDRADVLSNLGVALRAGGRLQEAVQALEKSVELAPDRAEPWLVLGDLLLQSGDAERAAGFYRKNLELAPESPGGLFGLGRVLHAAGHYQQALPLLVAAYNKLPDNPAVVLALAWSLFQNARLKEALALFEKVAQVPAVALQAITGAATVELQLARPESALARLAELEPEQAGSADILQLRAAAERMRGDRQEAVLLYRQALAVRPDHIGCWYDLAQLAPEVFSERDMAALEKQLDSTREPRERSQLHFARARVLEEQQSWEEEFRALEQANQARRQIAPYHRERAEQLHELVRRRFSPDFLKRTAGGGDDSVQPLFILGMPRSGTTLIEQVLSSHSRVAACGESLARSVALAEMQSARGLDRADQWLAEAGPEEVTDFAHRYLRYVRDQLEIQGNVFTDKAMTHYRFLPLLAAAFPRARFIEMRRSPMDLCLSCYRLPFSHGQEFSYDLADCAHALAQYRKLMAYWRETFPDIQVYDLAYEDFVSGQEEETRALLAHCGLEWEDACLRFQESGRAVATASQQQVRARLNRRGVERWRRYGELLSPLREALIGEGVDPV